MTLYKKYRPLTLEEIVGNVTTIRKIAKSMDRTESSRAILLTGETGVGKTTVAKVMSRKIYGLNDSQDLQREMNYKEISAGSYRGINMARYIIGQLQYKTMGFSPRVYFFDECGALTPQAQTALLKPIEDTIEECHFLFATSEPQKLLPAFKSRCIQYHMEPPTEDEIFDLLNTIALKEGMAVSEEAAKEIVKLSQCHPREALVMLEEILPLPLEEQKASLRNVNFQNPEKYIKPPTKRSDKVHTPTTKSTSVSPTPTFNNTKDSKFLLQVIEKIACTSTELLKKKLTPPTMFLLPFIYAGALIMIFAEPGVGKTHLAWLIAVVLTRPNSKGFNIGPFKVEKQCGVFILDGEMFVYQVQTGISTSAGPMGDESNEFPIIIMTSEETSEKYGRSINLEEESWRIAIYSYIEKNPHVKLVIVDNLTSLTSGMNENSKEAWGPINQWLLTLRRLGVAVIILHHANKGGGYSGHSAQIRNLDTVIRLKKMGAEDELCFQVEYVKSRTAKPGEANSFVLKADKHPDNPEWLIWEHHTDNQSKCPRTAQDDQIMVATMTGKMPQREIATAFGVSQPKVSNCKRQAVDRGLISQTGEITEAGAEFIREFELKQEG